MLIRTYFRDLPWLRFALAAIEAHCAGFAETVVVTPRWSASRVRRSLPGWVRLVVCPDYRDDYLGQQVSKLYADECTDAELICHVDSDMIFCGPAGPADLLQDGRVRVVGRPVAELGRHRPWLASTEGFLGWPVTHDFMRHPPFTFPRWLYPEVREYARVTHRTNLAEYVLGRPPRGFSEFNVLGAYAYARHRPAFAWTGTGPELCRWYWSRAGIDPALHRELEVLVGPARPRRA